MVLFRTIASGNVVDAAMSTTDGASPDPAFCGMGAGEASVDGVGDARVIHSGRGDGHDSIIGFDAARDRIDIDSLFAVFGYDVRFEIIPNDPDGLSYTIRVGDGDGAVEIDVSNSWATSLNNFVSSVLAPKKPNFKRGCKALLEGKLSSGWDQPALHGKFGKRRREALEES